MKRDERDVAKAIAEAQLRHDDEKKREREAMRTVEELRAAAGLSPAWRAMSGPSFIKVAAEDDTKGSENK